MALFKVKPEVNFDVSPELGFVLGYTRALWSTAGFGEFVVTSAKDGKHMAGSKHETGEAADVRTRDRFNTHEGKHSPIMQSFRDELRRTLGPHGVDIVLHPDDDAPGGRVPPHLHLEYDPRGTRVLAEQEKI